METQEDMDYESEEISDTEKRFIFHKRRVFIKVTDQELIDKGYLLKVGYPVYLHKIT